MEIRERYFRFYKNLLLFFPVFYCGAWLTQLGTGVDPWYIQIFFWTVPPVVYLLQRRFKFFEDRVVIPFVWSIAYAIVVHNGWVWVLNSAGKNNQMYFAIFMLVIVVTSTVFFTVKQNVIFMFYCSVVAGIFAHFGHADVFSSIMLVIATSGVHIMMLVDRQKLIQSQEDLLDYKRKTEVKLEELEKIKTIVFSALKTDAILVDSSNGKIVYCTGNPVGMNQQDKGWSIGHTLTELGNQRKFSKQKISELNINFSNCVVNLKEVVSRHFKFRPIFVAGNLRYVLVIDKN